MKIAPRPKRTRVEPIIDAPDAGIRCAECGGPMRLLRLIENATERQIGLFYGCKRYPDCYCTHSAHPDGRPMGTPANAATRAKRHEAHEAFDQLWKRGGWMTRAAAYRWLAEQFGTDEAHMGEMSIEECEKVIRLATSKRNELNNERKRIEQRRKKAKVHIRTRDALAADRQHRAERHDAKRLRMQRSEPPPAAPKPEPEEEPPRRWRREDALRLFSALECSSLIRLAEGVSFDEPEDMLQFSDSERTACRWLRRRAQAGR